MNILIPTAAALLITTYGSNITSLPHFFASLFIWTVLFLAIWDLLHQGWKDEE